MLNLVVRKTSVAMIICHRQNSTRLHEIVKSGDYELRVELEDQAGERAYAGYTNFMIGGPSTSYTLGVSGFFGNASMERGERQRQR